MKLPVVTYDEIMGLRPCFDPAAKGICTKDWKGTALDVLRAEHKKLTDEDKLWTVLRPEFLDLGLLHQFGLWVALHVIAETGAMTPSVEQIVNWKIDWIQGDVPPEPLMTWQNTTTYFGVMMHRLTSPDAHSCAWYTFLHGGQYLCDEKDLNYLAFDAFVIEKLIAMIDEHYTV